MCRTCTTHADRIASGELTAAQADCIRQIGLGRGHGYDLELLVELEKVVSRRFAKHSNA